MQKSSRTEECDISMNSDPDELPFQSARKISMAKMVLNGGYFGMASEVES
jgi:hypothetical protein